MKKFDQIKKHMNPDKNKPVKEKISIDFLPLNKFLCHNHINYEHEIIIKFFESNNISLKNFYSARKGDKECSTCGKNSWLIWSNGFMYYDTLNNCLINTEDDEELEESPELQEIDFTVYVCAKCGAWSTSILKNSSASEE